MITQDLSSQSSKVVSHRIAVEWEDGEATKEGVYVPRRDTDSRMNAWAGGRVFPGVHHHSRFTIDDTHGHISIRVDATDQDGPLVNLQVKESRDFPSGSVFSSLEESSTFFESGCIGYSPRPDCSTLDGLLLSVPDWRVSPLVLENVSSAYFDDRSLFPEGSIEFDHALLMRNISHEWHSEPSMVC